MRFKRLRWAAACQSPWYESARLTDRFRMSWTCDATSRLLVRAVTGLHPRRRRRQPRSTAIFVVRRSHGESRREGPPRRCDRRRRREALGCRMRSMRHAIPSCSRRRRERATMVACPLTGCVRGRWPRTASRARALGPACRRLGRQARHRVRILRWRPRCRDAEAVREDRARFCALPSRCLAGRSEGTAAREKRRRSSR